MDVRTLKKGLGVGLLSAAAITNSSAHAANANVTVDVNLPTVLVMYHYNTVTLDVDQTALGSYLIAGAPIPCVGDLCSDLGNPANVTVNVLGPTTTVSPPALPEAGLTGTTATTFELVDVVGVRALGCTAPYSASYDVTGSAGVTAAAGVLIEEIDGTACTLGLTTGNLSFDLDFNAVATATAQAVFNVTITGV